MESPNRCCTLIKLNEDGLVISIGLSIENTEKIYGENNLLKIRNQLQEHWFCMLFASKVLSTKYDR